MLVPTLGESIFGFGKPKWKRMEFRLITRKAWSGFAVLCISWITWGMLKVSKSFLLLLGKEKEMSVTTVSWSKNDLLSASMGVRFFPYGRFKPKWNDIQCAKAMHIKLWQFLTIVLTFIYSFSYLSTAKLLQPLSATYYPHCCYTFLDQGWFQVRTEPLLHSKMEGTLEQGILCPTAAYKGAGNCVDITVLK